MEICISKKYMFQDFSAFTKCLDLYVVDKQVLIIYSLKNVFIYYILFNDVAFPMDDERGKTVETAYKTN